MRNEWEGWIIVDGHSVAHSAGPTSSAVLKQLAEEFSRYGISGCTVIVQRKKS